MVFQMHSLALPQGGRWVWESSPRQKAPGSPSTQCKFDDIYITSFLSERHLGPKQNAFVQEHKESRSQLRVPLVRNKRMGGREGNQEVSVPTSND